MEVTDEGSDYHVLSKNAAGGERPSRHSYLPHWVHTDRQNGEIAPNCMFDLWIRDNKLRNLTPIPP